MKPSKESINNHYKAISDMVEKMKSWKPEKSDRNTKPHNDRLGQLFQKCGIKGNFC
jgi:hypothetical protein